MIRMGDHEQRVGELLAIAKDPNAKQLQHSSTFVSTDSTYANLMHTTHPRPKSPFRAALARAESGQHSSTFVPTDSTYANLLHTTHPPPMSPFRAALARAESGRRPVTPDKSQCAMPVGDTSLSLGQHRTKVVEKNEWVNRCGSKVLDYLGIPDT